MQKNYRIRFLILVLFCAALLGIVLRGINCPFRSLTGIPCPGCGMTRAWLAALRLDLASAFRCHPVFWGVPVLMAYCFFDGRLFRKNWLNYGLLALIGSGTLANYLVNLVAFFQGSYV